MKPPADARVSAPGEPTGRRPRLGLPGLAALALVLAAPAVAQRTVDPASVLIVVNDNTSPEPGTGGIPAGQYVADHYAAARGIPAGNIVHIRTNPACLDVPAGWDCWNISWADFVANVREPIRAFLSAAKLTRKITYIVPTYGVPSHINGHPQGVSGLSLDSFLATMNTSYADSVFVRNPSYDPNPTGTQPLSYSSFWSLYYAVVRLDGPNAQIAAGLVDKALAAERGISRSSGVGYFDWRHLNGADGYAMADRTMKAAYQLCVAAGMRCVLNDQAAAGGMIGSAPDTLWAWGWYSGPTVNDVYTFVPGAVGAQLTSYTATAIRRPAAGAWVPLWLERGITATWGATAEPYLSGYAMGHGLLNRLWNGFSFGDASYIVCPKLGWMMVFVGDPLFRPRFID